jgi:Lhr-like helicase
MSATTKPIEVMTGFLTGVTDEPCTVIDEGHARERDLKLELPGSPLEAIMSAEVWIEEYDRLAELIRAHRTTLVFVNTRRLAERAARHLAERLGEDAVTSHHGSLAKEHRLKAEERLKAGQLKALVATASLELGIDIGDVDLVCQLGSPHGISAFLQRVGRSGHGLGRIPKGRLFPLSRDDLVECTALLASIKRRELDAISPRPQPLDVLAQQIVAEVGVQEWKADALHKRFTHAASYKDLKLDEFVGVARIRRGFGRTAAARHLHSTASTAVRAWRNAHAAVTTRRDRISSTRGRALQRLPSAHSRGPRQAHSSQHAYRIQVAGLRGCAWPAADDSVLARRRRAATMTLELRRALNETIAGLLDRTGPDGVLQLAEVGLGRR